jgi:hypothetical protein
MKGYPLLPGDLYLASALGLTEEEYKYFRDEVRSRSKIEPGKPQAGLEVLIGISIFTSLVSVGLAIAASFFKPRETRPPQLKSSNRSATNVVNNARFAPVAGFDNSQDIADLGSVIPVVYANKKGKCGGVRVNMPLIWADMHSFKAGQFFRGIFLIGEGNIDQVDTRGFAIGSTGMNGYELEGPASDHARFTIYLRPDGGRIRTSDRLTGRPGERDLGAWEAGNVYRVRSGSDFSASSKPSAQTTFGVYTLIGNNLGYRVNPVIRPTITPQLIPFGKKGNAEVLIEPDLVAQADLLKYKAKFSTRSGIIAGSFDSVGDTFNYILDRSSDLNTDFEALVDDGSDTEITVEIDDNVFWYGIGKKGGIKAGEGIPDSEVESWADVTAAVNNENNTITVFFSFKTNRATNKIAESGFSSQSIVLNYKVKVKTGKKKLSYDFKVKGVVETSRKFKTDGDIKVKTELNDKGTKATSTATGDFKTDTDDFFEIKWKNVNQQETDRISKKDRRVKRKSSDVALSVAGKQRTWDDAIVPGELYKVGTALAVCTSRTRSPFVSNADMENSGSGKSVEATFTIIRAGDARVESYGVLTERGTNFNVDRRVATNYPHLFRVAIANFTTIRECRNVEIGIRSTLGIRVGGICNFKDTLTQEETNLKAGQAEEGELIMKGDTLKTESNISGQYSVPEERYSFFRVSYRVANQGGSFTRFQNVFGVVSLTQQNVYNKLSLQMPFVAQWEFEFEPLSGWEIREKINDPTVIVLDASEGDGKVSTFTSSVTAGGATLFYVGRTVPRTRETFSLNATQRNEDIGIGHMNGNNYADGWGKLAEDFVYQEITSSAASGPEHEIVYVTESIENATVPNYDNLAIVGLNMRSTLEWSQLSQFSCYVTRGRRIRRLLEGDTIGASNLFPDILLDLLTNKRFGAGDSISEQQIDIESFRAAAQWCESRNYYFDGAITDKQNLRSWASDVAASNLLDFSQKDGKFTLEPAIIFGSPVPIKGLFTAGNIVKDSFQMEFLEEEDRQPVQASVKWRQERTSTSLTAPASFAVEREVLVREAFESDSLPIESFDFTAYCTSIEQAIDFACYIIRLRRLITHSVKFATTPDGLTAGIGVGDYIRVAMDYTIYDEFANGVVLPDGTLSTTRPELLTAGSHQVTAWAGGDGPIYETNLIVSTDLKTASPTGIVFVKKSNVSQVRTYKVESVSLGEEGQINIEAVHHPTDGNGVSMIGKDWTTYSTNANWVIRRG